MEMGPLTEFVFGPYLANGGGQSTGVEPSFVDAARFARIF